jgi:cold shock CspA family protein
MTETILRTAHTMAQVWVQRGTDPNEVAKSLRYLTEHPNGRRFFDYLNTVMREGRSVVRSGRSLDYYRQIEEVCRKHLGPYQEEPEEMAQILGWAVRLMRYYQVEPDLEQPPVRTPRPPAPPPLARTAPATASAASQVPPGYQQGRVKNFGLGPKKSFGFIYPQTGGREIFVHRDGLAKGVSSLEEGQEVIFKVVQTPKGLKAEDVRPLE